MNDRIKELALQAGLQLGTVLENYTTPVKTITVEQQKFAELIVTECIAQCEKVASEANDLAKSKFVTDAGRMLHEGMWGGAKNSGAQIKQHFYGDEE